ncbi:Adaptive-response sensory-kinase SasA [Vibrio stylophorae]|uniref:histidine kinase n=1 Tax=Vibrio stylophorae TaxID=659351 RepID=A0ABN8DSR2_9VIBR|nr:ATP-binding protein [Vibrio stylophorae]CAH0533373.1 Adaptive-response sensory-kinase SasA [Vibrio stylophorae]
MPPYAIICIDDDATIVAQLSQELAYLSEQFDIVCVDNPDEADYVLASMHQRQQEAALVLCDDDLGKETGIEFFIRLHQHPTTARAYKILLTDTPDVGQILTAVNEGQLDHCLTKPWQPVALRQAVEKELTNFILDHAKVDEYLGYSHLLDTQRLIKAHIEQQMQQFRSGFIEDYYQLDDQTLSQQFLTALQDFFDGNNEDEACRTYSKNHLLTEEGKENQFLWFIAEGNVVLTKRDEDGHDHQVVRYGRGDLVGGMSFVTGEPSFSTGRTLSQTKVIKIDRPLFSKVMKSKNELLPLFTTLLLRHFNRRLQRSIKTEMALHSALNHLETATDQLLEKEKMAMLGQLVAGVAHELNNPVAAILRGADTLKSSFEFILSNELDRDTHELGETILRRALEVRPLSTAQARAQAKNLEALTDDRQLARKLVIMGLDEPSQLVHWQHLTTQQLEQSTALWDQYYQAGNFLRSIHVCAKRIADMVKSLKSYARQDDESWHLVDIHEGLEDTLVIFENRLKRIEVEKSYHTLPAIHCQPIALQQVWTNLIANALDAMESFGARPKLCVETKLAKQNQYVEVTLTDNGCGMDAATIARIFELNYTTKREGNFGLGIGMSVCQQIIHQHQGEIIVTSEPEKYTQMRILLPISAPQHQAHGANHESISHPMRR